MSNTFHQIYVHSVFAVKYRAATIHPQWKAKFQAVIGNLINESNCQTLIVNGVSDHLHCFFSLRPSVSISKLMQHAKAKSSKWINETGLLQHRFEWQKGFGAFSYGHSQVESVFRYIQDQEEHHQKQTFRDEYISLLRKFEIDYDESYLFKALI